MLANRKNVVFPFRVMKISYYLFSLIPTERIENKSNIGQTVSEEFGYKLEKIVYLKVLSVLCKTVSVFYVEPWNRFM